MMRSNRMIWSLGVLLLILVLSACGDQVPVTESIPEPTATEPASTPEPVAPVPSPTVAEPVATTQVPEEGIVTNQPTVPNPPDPGPEPLIAQAKEDLAQRLSIPIDQIKVLEVEEVVWPDASLGCPQPDMMYAQVITPGFRLVLEAGGELHEFHTDVVSIILLCEEPDTGQTPAKEPDTTLQDGWPSQPREDDVIIVPPLKWKRP